MIHSHGRSKSQQIPTLETNVATRTATSGMQNIQCEEKDYQLNDFWLGECKICIVATSIKKLV